MPALSSPVLSRIAGTSTSHATPFFFACQGVSEADLKRLEKEVREQEQLLTGYQQENERLYKDLKQVQAKEKASEARMFSENQKLGKHAPQSFPLL